MADRARRKRRRLSRSGEFERVYREGRSHASRHLVVYAFPRSDDESDPRLGVSVGRKLGGAVERNRIKRLLQACAAAVLGPQVQVELVAPGAPDDPPPPAPRHAATGGATVFVCAPDERRRLVAKRFGRILQSCAASVLGPAAKELT